MTNAGPDEPGSIDRWEAFLESIAANVGTIAADVERLVRAADRLYVVSWLILVALVGVIIANG